jgi:multiple sugar transport system permease protein
MSSQWTKSVEEKHRDTISTARDNVEEKLSSSYAMALITVVPAATLFIGVVASPIVWAIAASFYSIPAFSPNWTWVGLENYRFILSDPEFWGSLGRNLVFAVGTSLTNTFFGVVIALLLNRKFRFKRVITPITLFPYLVPTAFFGYMILWIGSPQFGVVNLTLQSLGIIDSSVAWFTNDAVVSIISVITIYNWKFSVFVAILVFAKLSSIPQDFYEAAMTSGASRYQQFRDITFPYIKNILFITILLRGVWNFNKFDIFWVLSQGIPIDHLTTVPVYAYIQAFNFQQLGVANAVSVILFVILSIAAIIYFRTAKPSEEIRIE